jgi:cell division control protein 6
MESPRRTRSTRSTVLGKRGLPHDDSLSLSTCDAAPMTPEPTPIAKRAKTSPAAMVGDGHNNKENIPPLRALQLSPVSPARTRSLRRTASTMMTPSPRPSGFAFYYKRVMTASLTSLSGK